MKKIMLVEDRLEVRELCFFLLKEALGDRAIITECSSGNEAIRTLKNNEGFDLIISDYNMPDGNGSDLLNYKLFAEIKCPFIFFTSEEDLEIPYSGDSYIGVFNKRYINEMIASAKDLLK